MNVAKFIDGITTKTVTVDGVAVGGILRVSSVPFVSALPVENVFLGLGLCTKGGQRPGIFSPSVDDGYYVKVDNLSAGMHTLQITATNGKGFDLNVTYVLDVVPVSLQ
jgi:hypothetical protein